MTEAPRAPKFYGGGYALQTYGGRWRAVRVLGEGGQGRVFEVEDARGIPDRGELAQLIQVAFREMNQEISAMQPDTVKFDKFVQAVRTVVKTEHLPRAAVKELLPLADAVNATTALQRMETELETMRSIEHPALLKVLDEDIKHRWFVMEYFANGPMSKQPQRYKGQVIETLRAFRPIVDAVAELHKASIVHRDIKPDNIFVGDDGRLVLGDCGLAIKLQGQERLTTTYEKVGTTDWMPGWALGMRLEDVKPSFDVFSLGKLLWSMVSGRERLRLWYFKKREFSLTHMFPDNNQMEVVNDILAKTVVEEPEHCLASATEMLEAVDEAISAIEARTHRPGQAGTMRCRFCGRGNYAKTSFFQEDGFQRASDRRYSYICDNCGHIEAFFWAEGKLPVGWEG
ncbi:MAG: protein kinase [Vicinamibacterales bacterium]